MSGHTMLFVTGGQEDLGLVSRILAFGEVYLCIKKETIQIRLARKD